MSRSFRAGLVQMRTGTDIARNIEDAVRLIEEACRQGAELVTTPEMTNVIEASQEALLPKLSDEGRDPLVSALRDVARERRIHLLIGSVAIRSGDKLVNRSLLIAPDGAVVARYDKIHMFDVDLDGGESYRESRTYRAGDTAVLAELPWGRLGLTICYDVRFPQLYRALAKAGADFVTVPSAFTRQTGEAHWHTLLRARAIETGCYMFAPAQGGAHESGRTTYGHSLIASPWGEVVAEIAGDEPGVAVADIDLEAVSAARRRIPALEHDRPFRVAEPVAAKHQVPA